MSLQTNDAAHANGLSSLVPFGVPAGDVANARRRNPIARGYFRKRLSACASLKNSWMLRERDTRSCEAVPRRKPAPTLCIHIAHVFCLRSDKEVAWIHATRNIAAMQNAHAVRDAPVDKRPGYSVSKRASVAACLSEVEDSVAASLNNACPEPASICSHEPRREPGQKHGLLQRNNDTIVKQHGRLLGASVLGAGGGYMPPSASPSYSLEAA